MKNSEQRTKCDISNVFFFFSSFQIKAQKNTIKSINRNIPKWYKFYGRQSRGLNAFQILFFFFALHGFGTRCNLFELNAVFTVSNLCTASHSPMKRLYAIIAAAINNAVGVDRLIRASISYIFRLNIDGTLNYWTFCTQKCRKVCTQKTLWYIDYRRFRVKFEKDRV